MDTAPIVELCDVRVSRGSYEILRGVSLAVAEGECLVLVGPAGSGKSVLLKVAAGIIVPDSGEVRFRGKPQAKMSKAEEGDFRRRIGFVFQDAALWSNQNLFDNLALPVRVHRHAATKREIEAAVFRAAEAVGYDVDLKLRPSELSSGERRLVGLARALVLDPEVLFVDEPTASLDEEAAERVLDVLEALKARGKCVVAVSSGSGFASRFADKLGYLRAGQILALGSFEEAKAWTSPGLRALSARLGPRGQTLFSPAAMARVAALAWGSAPGAPVALAEEQVPAELPAQAPAGSAAETSKTGGESDTTLGDIVNAVSDEGGQSGGGES
jgi:phospholipid/cholesterol/gamma-HCH transport system ATP-binding protein